MAVDPLYVELDAERVRQGVDVQDWAAAAGVAQSTVYKLIKGETRGMVFIARALAAALGMELVVQPKSRVDGPP